MQAGEIMTEHNKDRKQDIIAYLSDGAQWSESDIEGAKLTCINYAFGVIKDGLLKGEHLKKLSLLQQVKTQYPELKVVLSIGGWGADGFSDAALTKESRTAFIDSTLKFVVSHHFDGVDLDWEYPGDDQAGIKARPQDRQNFTDLLREFRESLSKQGELDGKHYILSIALGAGQQYVEGIEMDKVHPLLNTINVMTYDLRGSFTHRTGHHANLFAQSGDPDGISGDKAVQLLLQAGVPRDKIVLGAAFYARIWEGVTDDRDGLNAQAEATGCKTCDYTILAEHYIGRNGFTRHWDDNAKVPYLFDGNSFVSYEDEESVKCKAEYVIENGLGGIMFWEYPLDKTKKLLHSIHSVLG